MTAGSHAQSGLDVRRKTRITAVLFAFAIWFVIILLRLSQYMVFERDRHLADMTRASIYEGVIPAKRGRLLDRNGVPLAWSQRRFSLTWRVPSDRDAAHSELARITSALPGLRVGDDGLPGAPGASVTLSRDLTVSEASALASLCAELGGLSLTGTFVRRHSLAGKGGRQLGRVARVDGTEVGVSGYELTHDAFLRGRPGMFRVMVDKRGQWIPETWEKVRDMRPGYDVYLPLRATTLAERDT
jgi:cell division protein FtsI (penicillin-binding protein 3)